MTHSDTFRFAAKMSRGLSEGERRRGRVEFFALKCSSISCKMKLLILGAWKGK